MIMEYPLKLKNEFLITKHQASLKKKIDNEIGESHKIEAR